MQKNLLYVIVLWAVSYSLVGCSEIDPEKFSEAPGVNFMSKGSTGWSDGVDGLKIAYNFGVNFKEWNAPQDTVVLQVKLEGLTSIQPLKIRLKAEKVENSDWRMWFLLTTMFWLPVRMWHSCRLS